MLDTILHQMEHTFFFNSFFGNFIYLFIFGGAGSSLICGLFFNCSEEELFFVASCGLLILMASPVAEHRL